MAIEGPLRELALSDVLQLLDLSRKTGVLTVSSQSRGRRGEVRFEQGAVVGASLPGHSGRLGQLLLLAGKVTQRQVDRALEAQRASPGRLLGGLLVEADAVSAEEVARQLRFQVEETVFELVRWTEGDFRFEETAPAGDELVSLRVPTEALLMESARRIDEWTTLSDRVPDRNVVPRLVEQSSASGSVLNLFPREWEVLAEVDGERSLQAIARELGRAEFEVAKTIFSLASSGVVEVGRRREPAPPAPAGDSSAEAALARGRALAGRGDWGGAAESFARAVAHDPLLAPAYYSLGFAAVRTGDLGGAEEAWRTYVRLAGAESPRAAVALRGIAAVSDLLRVVEEVEA